MKFIKSAFILLLFFTQASNGQEILDWSAYFKLLNKADSLFRVKNYAESAQAYSYAFQFNNQRFSNGDRYNAARAWAMSGQMDSAIHNLKRDINERAYFDIKAIKNESSFQSLHKMKEWKLLLETVELNQKKENEKLGSLKPVKEKLEEVLRSDQKYRHSIDSLISRFGYDTKAVRAVEKKMKKIDDKNLEYVSSVVDKYGWPDYNIVGFDASAAVFLVIQHSDSLTQEKYLPVMRQAVSDKKAISGELALLEDRVLVRRGKKQLYGTQVQMDSIGNWQVAPIDDEANVDQRRAAVGLQPLADYLKRFNIIYKKPD